MIVTLTLNPSLDRTFHVDRIEPGGVNRVRAVWTEPAGKGVNVSKALHKHEVPTTVVIPVGGADGIELARLLESEGVAVQAVPITGSVRSNVTVVESGGTVTKFNEPGPVVTERELGALIDATAQRAESADWVVASGNLPPSAPNDVYTELIQRLASTGARVAVDTSGAALVDASRAGPDLLKPNLEELEELVDRSVRTLGEVVDAATDLIESGVGCVLVSLGAHGAVAVDRTESLYGWVEVDDVGNTVGAGDTLLAGFLAGRDGDTKSALGTALAWARAAVRTPTTGMDEVAQSDVEAVHIETSIDRSRPVGERSHP